MYAFVIANWLMRYVLTLQNFSFNEKFTLILIIHAITYATITPILKNKKWILNWFIAKLKLFLAYHGWVKYVFQPLMLMIK